MFSPSYPCFAPLGSEIHLLSKFRSLAEKLGSSALGIPCPLDPGSLASPGHECF
jgi:hypothetical protein